MAAVLAGPQLLVGVELLDDRLELLALVDQLEVGVVADLAAALAEPAQMILFTFGAAAYASVPNYGLLQKITIPESPQVRHAIISTGPLITFIATSVVLAFWE